MECAIKTWAPSNWHHHLTPTAQYTTRDGDTGRAPIHGADRRTQSFRWRSMSLLRISSLCRMELANIARGSQITIGHERLQNAPNLSGSSRSLLGRALCPASSAGRRSQQVAPTECHISAERCPRRMGIMWASTLVSVTPNNTF